MKTDVRLTVATLVITFFLVFYGNLTHKTLIVSQINSLPTPNVYVDPQTSYGTVGQNFVIKISISDVSDLYGWEIKLQWNPILLDAATITEGQFLKSHGNTYFTYKINNTAGYVIIDCTLLGLRPGVSGSGILATVEFHVKSGGESSLDLYDTKLIDPGEHLIPHTATDGYFEASAHDIAIIDIAASLSNIDVTLENQGTYIEAFQVSVYYKLQVDTLVGTKPVNLYAGAVTTLSFTWSPLGDGEYEIRAEASTVPSETDTADNIRKISFSIELGEGGFTGTMPLMI
jgi:hypothetical protein